MNPPKVYHSATLSQQREASAALICTMRIEGIGELVDRSSHWELIYDHCGHSQQFARLGLDDAEQAAQQVRRFYAECLTCRMLNSGYIVSPPDSSSSLDQ